ncbi:MAG TPA: glycerol-3-phosphate dehydrogenase/oxidase, partial [Planctomycetaceae bacterium]
MNRDQALRTISDRRDPWDVLVIGGGATGLGTAVDAASRGYSTLLLEQHDFAKGTSSRSTKLIHGGVRYLAQGRLGLVRTALQERDILLRNAPHLVHDLKFIVPAYALWELPFYFAGLKTYDLLSGGFGRGRSQWLSCRETLERAPTLVRDSLRGGILYHDCQFDDARLALTLTRTLVDLGGTAVNYFRVTGLLKKSDKVCGVRACDVETGRDLEVRARAVINATGVFTDQILQMDEAQSRPLITPSQGIHVVLDRAALPGDCAVVVPHTDDSRILFAIPWHGRVLVGTTDTPVAGPSLEPRPLDDELEFLLSNAARYLTTIPDRADILSIFAGLRPLIAGKQSRNTAQASRDHHIEVSPAGLVTIAGGKWTTYRHMGEEAVDTAQRTAGLPPRQSETRTLHLHGWCADIDLPEPLAIYGSDAAGIRKLALEDPQLGERLHPDLPYLKAEVVWAARHEMARTVEDVLARRTRALFLDARASIEMANAVADLLAAELGRDAEWAARQVAEFTELASG